jgi:predicted nucleic acid-binding protein
LARLRRKALERAVKRNATCLLDSSFVLSYLDGGQRTSEAAGTVVDDWLAHNRNRGIICALTAMEAAAQPMRLNDATALQQVMDFLRSFPNLRLLGIDEHCAFEAARIRAATKIAAPQALILATALLHSADLILTADKSLKSKIGALSDCPQVVCLEDYL